MINLRVAIAEAADRVHQDNKRLKILLMQAKDEIVRLSRFVSHLVCTLTPKEKELRDTNARLQIELALKIVEQEMLRKQVEETRLALEREREVSELKSRFIAIACHEFRTPLTSILLSCEFLKNHQHKLTEDARLRYFRQIKSSVKNMNQILEDVLIAGSVQAGKLQFKPAPLALVNFCFDLVEQIQLSAGDRYTIHFISQCSYNSTIKDRPLMDENLLRHILTNLLSNAIKYSPEGGDIHFNLICDQESVILRIQDHGIGIPEEEQGELFTSFFRCSNTGKLPGTGLGLTIVKNAVELHGGQITVESGVGLGTTFTVILPINYPVTSEKILEKKGS
ncbi:MAG: HAMP domain-containing histidine kinase [Aetokthonos hydrillicola CCALA 1050]|jgi:signal transduction histidine kinase|nr:HAMP domain-containing histidine kinase [Aetokthonos hydrillicola CCALA 1050]MBW4589157.1 HAMP domain-containing histidine kinase [Aetokthonos hydrillicola CCALA 1050]